MTLSSVVPGVSSESPKIRTESRRPCCPWLSTATFKLATSCSSLWTFSSFSRASVFSLSTVWHRDLIVSDNLLETGSNNVLKIGSKISLYLSITSWYWRALSNEHLYSTMISELSLSLLVIIDMRRSEWHCQFCLAGFSSILAESACHGHSFQGLVFYRPRGLLFHKLHINHTDPLTLFKLLLLIVPTTNGNVSSF